MSAPAIVIPCYNRVHSLKRLLESLERAFEGKKDQQVPIIFSVDFSGQHDVGKFADEYAWEFGPKETIHHPGNIGLKENILFCGDLSGKYETIILLEDDSVVSPGFYEYALQTLEKYKRDPLVAQISLYAYEYSEIRLERFHPLYVGNDVYGMQWPSSRGQLWTRTQWGGFRKWLQENPDLDLEKRHLPEQCYKWSHSWKKHFAEYLVTQNLFVIYPYYGFATNYGDCGTNVLAHSVPDVQSPLAFECPDALRLPQFSECSVLYDVFFQPLPRTVNTLLPELADYEYEVDFQSSKPFENINKKYLLSTRPCNNPLRSYNWNLFPIEMNLQMEPNGNRIFFGERKDFTDNPSKIQEMLLAVWSKRLMMTKDYLKYTPLRFVVSIVYKLNVLKKRVVKS